MSPPIQGLDVMSSEFRGTANTQVPVIRIFGPSETGVKSCVHIHGVFPYIYIPFDNEEPPNGIIYKIAQSLDQAINIALGQASSAVQHVYKIVLVSGIPFYGYHKGEHTFFKIYFHNPLIVKKACSVLENGSVLGKIFQPHEAHLPFHLQFMIDYNIHGMSFISLSDVRFRRNSLNTPEQLQLPANVAKMAVSAVELDSWAEYIVNRVEIQQGQLAVNPGIAALWDDERQRRRNKEESSQLSHCLTQTRTNLEPTATHKLFQKMLSERLQSGRRDEPFNATVYPAESLTLDDTLNSSSAELLPSQASQVDASPSLSDDTITNDLLHILNDLNRANEEVEMDGLENDAILSQMIDDVEDEFDQNFAPNAIETPDRELVVDDVELELKEGSVARQIFQSDGAADDVFSSNEMEEPMRILRTKQLRCLDGTNDSSDDDVTLKNISLEDESGRKIGKTAEENYDLERGFIPVAGTSKNEQFSLEYGPNNSMDFSLMDDTIIPLQTSPKPEDSQSLQSWTPSMPPPSYAIVKQTMGEYNIPALRHQEPFFGQPSDVTAGFEIGQTSLVRINSLTTKDLDTFRGNFLGLDEWRKQSNCSQFSKLAYVKNHTSFITPVQQPPSKKDVIRWLKGEQETHKNNKSEGKQKEPKHRRIILSDTQDGNESNDEESLSISSCSPMDSLDLIDTSQSSIDVVPTSPVLGKGRRRSKIKKVEPNEDSLRRSLLQSQLLHQITKAQDSYVITGSTQDMSQSFCISLENLQCAKAIIDHQHLTILILELHTSTRGDLKPHPNYDPINCVFYTLFNDVPADACVARERHGFIAVGDFNWSSASVASTFVPSEMDLLNALVDLVKDSDPDILLGYDIEMLSWGYLIERGYILSLNLPPMLARSTVRLNQKEDAELKVTGRIVLNLWRLLRHEVALQSYTLENIVYHILHRRIPSYSFHQLTQWWNAVKYRHLTINYYLERVRSQLLLLNQLDLIGTTSELARLFGIQFYEVLSRGSQFRVESMMLRLAKPLNYIAVSPNVQQRAHMKAPEGLPLILEPESKFYADPVIVLDFQSLYPSIIIAYNYCFSTCLGRVQSLGQETVFEFGCTQLKVPRRIVRRLSRQEQIVYSPCGVAFVKADVRRGILPRMLEEILDTRLMVKKSMKENKGDQLLQRVLHSRQLGLKLIANVTFGYTSANFSGRMPAVELGDSIISKARETLLRAIKLVEANAKWAARVIYGDTDSLFVLVEGRSKAEAFRIGAEIAEAVTSDNPSPVKLKLEKIFQPCILQTKKRYVGYMYEATDQLEAEFCAKGIETVRRDGCPAVSKMLERSLKILFDRRDVSEVRQYVLRQFKKILSGRISLQELTFAKEYRGASSYRPGACVPALELANKWKVVDPRSEPRKGERVPYVIVHGHPALPLIKLVRSPREVLADPSLHPNALYYVTKAIIPALNRCFLLIGADLNVWFNTMPRKQMQSLSTITPSSSSKKSTISQYFAMSNCLRCGRQNNEKICEKCARSPQSTYVVLQEEIVRLEQTYSDIHRICRTCCQTSDIQCVSLDCPIYYRRVQNGRDVQQLPILHTILRSTFDI